MNDGRLKSLKSPGGFGMFPCRRMFAHDWQKILRFLGCFWFVSAFGVASASRLGGDLFGQFGLWFGLLFCLLFGLPSAISGCPVSYASSLFGFSSLAGGYYDC